MTRRHDKYLFVRLDSGGWLLLHFGMTGWLKYFKDFEKEPSHDRLLITFSSGFLMPLALCLSCQVCPSRKSSPFHKKIRDSPHLICGAIRL
jgi:formamidopyrimidine-DNA glycosylase